MSKEKTSSGGIGLGVIIFAIFLFLKLAEIGTVATWSWWWVTAPLWIPIVVIFGLLAVVGIIALIAASIK
jgi:hypothetical protein